MTDTNTTPAGAVMEPLWTDTRIHELVESSYESVVDQVELEWLMAQMRDDYEAKLATASAQHEQLQRLLGEYQDLYLDAQRQRDALAAELAALRAERDEWVQDVNELDSSLAQSTYAVDDLREQLEALRAEPRYVPVSDGTHTLMNTDDAFVSVTVEDDGKQTIEHWQPGGVTPCPMPDSYRLCRLVPGQDTQPGESNDNI